METVRNRWFVLNYYFQFVKQLVLPRHKKQKIKFAIILMYHQHVNIALCGQLLVRYNQKHPPINPDGGSERALALANA